MKSKDEVLEMFYATLTEFRSSNSSDAQRSIAYIKLDLLIDVLGDESIPEEYWPQIIDFN